MVDTISQNKIPLLQYVNSKEAQSKIINILESLSLVNKLEVLNGILQELANNKLNYYKLENILIYKLEIGTPIARELLLLLQSEVLKGYIDELEENAEKIYIERDEYIKTFSFDGLIEIVIEEYGLHFSEEQKKKFMVVLAKWFLGYESDNEITSILIKPVKINGLGLSEEDAKKIISGFQTQNEKMKKIDFDYTEYLVEFIATHNIGEAVIGQEYKEIIKKGVESVDREEAEQYFKEHPEYAYLINGGEAPANFQASTSSTVAQGSDESLSSVLDQLSNELGYGNTDNDTTGQPKPKE